MSAPSKTKPPQLIFVLGPLGTARSTVCARFASSSVDVAHLSIDELLRTLSVSTDRCPKEAYGGLTRLQIRNTLRVGMTIAAANIAAILRYAIEQYGSRGYSTVLIDGFPKSEAEYNVFQKGVGTPQAAIVFSTSKATALVRFLPPGVAPGHVPIAFNEAWADFEHGRAVIEKRYSGLVKDVGPVLRNDTNDDIYKLFLATVKRVLL